MDVLTLASGDNIGDTFSPRVEPDHEQKNGDSEFSEDGPEVDIPERIKNEAVTKQIIPDLLENNEQRIKERIAECRNIIESLKLELSAEKSKAENEQWRMKQELDIRNVNFTAEDYPVCSSRSYTDIPYNTEFYSASVDRKLSCDESLIQYEQQLQKYQKTLNMAQLEKRNVIRKQMLAKAFKLKLLEIENQCNTELIRVKQSMQCLEPLKLVADSWKNSNENSYNFVDFELIPRYPEVNGNLSSLKEVLGSQVTSDKSPRGSSDKDVSTLSENCKP